MTLGTMKRQKSPVNQTARKDLNKKEAKTDLSHLPSKFSDRPHSSSLDPCPRNAAVNLILGRRPSLFYELFPQLSSLGVGGKVPNYNLSYRASGWSRKEVTDSSASALGWAGGSFPGDTLIECNV